MEVLPFEMCFSDATGGNIKIKQTEYLTSGQIPIIDQGKTIIGGYTDDKDAIVKCKLPCVIYGDHSRNIKYFENPFAIGADGVKLLEPTEKIVAKYGYYFLQTVKLPEAGYDRSFKYLKRIQIPVPDLETQNKIVAILDKAKAILDKREQTIQKYDDLLRAIFLDMFGDVANNPKKLDKRPLKEFGEIITGNTPPRSDESNYNSKYIEWIKTDNILSESHFLTQSVEYLSETGFARARYVNENSLLVACIAGSIGSIGRSAIANRKVAFNQQINAVVPSNDVSVYFLYWMFKVSAEYIQSFATGGMKRLLTKGEFEKIPFIKPSHEEQLKFERIALTYSDFKSKLFQHRIISENLVRSLSQQVFSEKITIDIDAELEALIEAIDLEKKDWKSKKSNVKVFNKITNDITFTQRLIDKLNEQEYENSIQYDKAKCIMFRALQGNRFIKQVFDEDTKRVKVTVL